MHKMIILNLLDNQKISYEGTYSFQQKYESILYKIKLVCSTYT